MKGIRHYFMNNDKEVPITLVKRRSDMKSLGNHQYTATEVWLAYNDVGVGFGKSELTFTDYSETNPEMIAWQDAIRTRNSLLSTVTQVAQDNAIRQLIDLHGLKEVL